MPDPQTPWEAAVTRAMRTCVDVYGEGGAGLIIYTHLNGQAYVTDGIFEAATEAVDLDTGGPVLVNQPRVSFALADLKALPVKGDMCVIRGKRYAVIEPMFDGQGTVVLRLHEA